MNGIGTSYLSSLDHTAINEYGYYDLFRKLESAIQISRFPHTLREFSLDIGREVAELISFSETRLRIRLHGDFLKHQVNSKNSQPETVIISPGFFTRSAW